MNISIESLVASALEEGKKNVVSNNDDNNDAIKVASELEKLASEFENEAAQFHAHETEKTAKLKQAEELIDALVAVCEGEE